MKHFLIYTVLFEKRHNLTNFCRRRHFAHYDEKYPHQKTRLLLHYELQFYKCIKFEFIDSFMNRTTICILIFTIFLVMS